MSILLIFLSWLALCSAGFTDEMQTFESECLVEGAFTCLAGGCVAQEKYCDGNYDCEDGSDENFCLNHRPDEQYCNDTHQFLCADGLKCLPSAWVCNDEVECSDGSDESNCPTPVVSHIANSTCKGFQCDGKKCISNFWKCDGYYDCDDKSDEDVKTTCRYAILSKTFEDMFLHDVSYCEPRGRYNCQDKSYCLPLKNMCDGLNDCKDGSDEGAFCEHWYTMCKNFTCPQNAHCQPQRAGPTCECETYKRYNSTTRQCQETDHCAEEKPVCSHMCENKGTYFMCSCDHGYIPDMAKYLCFAPDPEALLFFNTRNDIRYVSVKSKHQVIATTGVKQAHAVSYNGEYLFWVENAQGHEAIMRARLDDVKDTKQVIAALGLEEPGDIAIDYLGDNIYFSDATRGVITACRSDGSACTTLPVATKHPKFVTLDPKQGKMYWVDLQDSEVIMHANMDGSGAEVLVANIGSVVTGLALDAPNRRLYYVDQNIKVVRLEDKRIYSFFEEPFHHPYSLAVFENTVFWSDFTSNTIQTADKMHGTNIKRNILLSLDAPVFDMHIYHPVLMNKAVNPCSVHQCVICLVTSNSSHVCACPDDMVMIGDHCQHAPGYRPQYLIVGAGSTFTRVHYNTIGNPETHGTHLDIGRVQAMAYDSRRDALYIYDSQRKSISHINMSDFTLGVTELLLYEGLENVVDMDYDFVSDTLYVLDAGRRVIEVVSLRNKHSALLYSFRDQEIPLSFCVMSDYGRMLVAVLESEDNSKIHIDSMGLDGTNREHLLLNDVLGPNVRLRYSPEMNVVYMSDEGNSVIDVIHPEGTGREMFREVLTTVASLAVTDTHVFWTDRRSARLYWADVHRHNTQQIRRIELSIFPNQTHLHVLATSPPPDARSPYRHHKCFQSPTPCSHICVQAPHRPHHTSVSDMGYSCRCPRGFLTFDRCMEFLECHAGEFFCHKSVECFPASKQCDGVKDCKFGEDEEGCDSVFRNGTQNPNTCPSDQTNCNGVCIPKNHACPDGSTSSDSPASALQCAGEEFPCADNSVCIERALACDGHSDCADGSDEHPDACDVRSCLRTEFMCATGECIPISWKCDRNEDCPDGSDEIGCDTTSCPEGSFRCGNGSCVAVYKRCDGKSDCDDHADEQGCDMSDFIEVSEHVITCSPWEHPCQLNKTMCLPLTARCNGKVDCPGGTDEDGCDFHCGGLNSTLFPCKQEYKCVRMTHVCNGRKDCSDGSDETLEACVRVNKTVPVLHPVHVHSNCSEGYRCDSGQCLEWALVCNNRTDCFDGSDEGGLCGTSCTPETCQQTCHPTRRGPQCTCSRGFAAQGSTCRDVDECEHRPCSHVCHNLPGSFVCACHRGYALRSDRRTCKALHGRLSVVYSRAHEVWSLTGHMHNLRFHTDEGTFADLDVDVRNKKLFASSSEERKLFQMSLAYGKVGQDPSVDWISNIGIPSKVSLDWVTGNLYFVDASAARCVRVCNFRRSGCARLLQLPDQAEVTALSVDPANRLLFYCISSLDKATVYSASLSGRNVSDIATVDSCSGLAVDSFSKTLYIASEQLASIVQVDYNGSPKTVLFFTTKGNKNLHSPRDIALFEDHIYFLSDAQLNRCLLFASKACDNYDTVNATTFVIRHESVQRDDIVNECEAHVCSNVCVLGASGPECVCHDGSVSNDGACPLVQTSELALFNGSTYQEHKSHSVSFVLIAAVLLLFALYLIIFVYYHFFKKKDGNLMQVRYKNAPRGERQHPNPLIEMPDSFGYNVVGGTAHEFVNPLQFVRNDWQDSFYKKKPIGTAGLAFDTQQNLSDTESNLDVRETERIISDKFH